MVIQRSVQLEIIVLYSIVGTRLPSGDYGLSIKYAEPGFIPSFVSAADLCVIKLLIEASLVSIYRSHIDHGWTIKRGLETSRNWT